MSDKEWQKNDNSSEAVILREKARLLFEKVKIGQADIDEVLSLMLQAAELGDAEAQSEVADAYRAEDDHVNAFRWEKKAAEQGYPKAQHNVAFHYQNGLGTPANPEQEFYWYQKAAENGLAEAKHSLAVCYLIGTGTPQDIKKGIHWLEQASNDGHAGAKTRLAGAYYDGIGVPADKEKGLSLLREAVALGDKKAKELLKEITGGSSKGGCYVATSIYGSYDCPEVWTLRRFRDDTLAHSWFGRQFIRVYYAVSPRIVDLFGNSAWFHRLWKPVINLLVVKLQNNGVDSSPYSGR